MRRFSRRLLGPLVLMGGTAVAGCGNLTSGGVGDLEVLVSADSVSLSAVPSSAFGLEEIGGRLAQAPADSQRIEGTLTIRLQVFVLRGPLRWVEVTDGIQEVTLSLGDPSPITIAQRDLPAGPYHAVRTLFRRVHVDVVSGLEFDGVLITGRIPVDLGLQDRLQIEKGLDLVVVEEGASEIVVNLHTHRWLRRLDRDRRVVSPEDFEREFAVRHQP